MALHSRPACDALALSAASCARSGFVPIFNDEMNSNATLGVNEENKLFSHGILSKSVYQLESSGNKHARFLVS